MRGDRERSRLDRRRLRRLAGGDLRALAEIYDGQARRLYRHALWLLRSREEAEDVVQNVMVRLAGMGADLLKVRHAAAYLMRMVHHEAIDRMKGRAGLSAGPMEEALVVADASDPEAAAEAAGLERLLARLEPAQREAVYLHLYEGLTFREIGRVTGVSIFTAASRYRIALERLRTWIGRP